MINVIIAAVLSLFFWGKATKDIEEKTQLASWTKTFVYFVLSLAVIVFYVKTYQVATIYSYIDVQGIEESRDSNGNVADTVDLIRITNVFSSGITENQDLNEKRNRISDPRVTDYGGIFVRIVVQDDSVFKCVRNPKFKNASLDIPIKDIDHCYMTSLLTSSFPSIFPLYPAWSISEEWTSDQKDTYVRLIGGDVRSNAVFEKKFRTPNLEGKNVETEYEKAHINGYMNGMISASKRSNKKVSTMQATVSGNFLNALNFFSAADLSQYIQAITIKSSCPVKNLEVAYDIPIEIENYDSCMTIGTTGYSFKGKYLEEMVNDGSQFLVKLPTLSNLQLIRSLVLTTILTALLALFFSNLFYVLRKNAIKVKENYFIEVSEIRTRKFKNRMIILLFILLFVFLYFIMLVYKDSPIYIPVLILGDWIEWIVLGTVLILIAIVYWQFRKAYDIKKKK